MRTVIASILAAVALTVPASASAASPNLHTLAERCEARAFCDFPTARFYRALNRAHGVQYPEDQAGALREAYALDNPTRRRAAVARAIAGIGY